MPLPSAFDPRPQQFSEEQIAALAGVPTASDARDSAVDIGFFVFSGGAAVWLTFRLLTEGFGRGWDLVWFGLLFWLVLTYLALPRLHRILTAIYVPDYFIGRARTSDGLLGDPINVALLGHEPQIHEAMLAAKWVRADDVTLRSSWHIVTATLRRKSYPEAPVSPLLLFDRQQDFAYQQEVDGSPGKRHHVRFWRCPPDWRLPGGGRADWLAAGTYDRAVGLSLFTLQVTHKIAADTDVERDHVVASLEASQPVSVHVIEDFSSGYHARNGGGDSIRTDGNLPVVDISGLPIGADAPRGKTDSRDTRPGPIIVGSLLVLARAASAATAAAGLVAAWSHAAHDVGGAGVADARALVTAWIAGIVVFVLAELALAWFVFLGRNWARVTVMSVSVVSIVLQALAARWVDGVPWGFGWTGVSVDILLIIALSSDRARLWAKRPVSRGKRIRGATARF